MHASGLLQSEISGSADLPQCESDIATIFGLPCCSSADACECIIFLFE
jgi:hypothetical protein